MHKSEGNSIFRIPPYYYIHILDQNTNVTRVEIGPKTYIRQDNEKVVFGPQQMITIPPRHYCIVENPVLLDAENKVVFDANNQAKLKHADLVSTIFFPPVMLGDNFFFLLHLIFHDIIEKRRPKPQAAKKLALLATHSTVILLTPFTSSPTHHQASCDILYFDFRIFV